MKRFLDYANQYIAQSDWKIIAMLKFCLFALGVIIGLAVPREKRKIPFMLAGTAFAVTYVPLAVKYVKIVMQGNKQ